MEILQGFKSNHNELDHCVELAPKDYKALRLQYREMVKEAIAFADVISKDRYDSKHKPIKFKLGD